MSMKTTKSKITVYIHRTERMRTEHKNTFQKQERPRIEVNMNGETQFMYADEFAAFIINNFVYGE